MQTDRWRSAVVDYDLELTASETGGGRMQELLGRIAALDPDACLGLRVIACFDELVVGNVNTRALLGAAASLTGVTAGWHRPRPSATLRVTPKGDFADDSSTVPEHSVECADGAMVWLERDGAPHANDAIVLERLALAIRIRHGRGRARTDRDRRDLGLLVDTDVPLETRRTAAAALGLNATMSYRVVAAPLFAVWDAHPAGPEDVIPTPFGTIHTSIAPASGTPADARPSGIGTSESIDHLHRSFTTALVALRLCDPPTVTSVDADDYGGLIGVLASTPSGSSSPDVDLLDGIMNHPWGSTTVDALVRSSTIRQAARTSGVHHSTLQTRLDTIIDALGYDPLSGLGRTRLGIAYLVWRLHHSRVLDLPAPDNTTRNASATPGPTPRQERTTA